MPLSVAEYLGQRTDNTLSDIIPCNIGGKITPACPFSGVACSKLKSSNPSHPICTVRDQNGRPFIVCADRLIPSKANALSALHIAALAAVSQVIFPSSKNHEIGYKRQISVSYAKRRRLVLDYVISLSPKANCNIVNRKVILEIQGGGETSSTGGITRHVTEWASLDNPTNEFLSTEINTEYLRKMLHDKAKKVNVPGIIPNNAWKRQLDQILKKVVLARKFNGAFAIVMGEVLYDYVQKTLVVGREYFPEWEIAIIGIAESKVLNADSIRFDSIYKSAFLTFEDFIAALQDFNIPDNIKNPFLGEFTTFRNNNFTVD